MSGLLAQLTSFLLVYKYSALFLLIILGSAGVVIPTVTIVVAAGAFAGQGYMSWIGVTVVAIVASMAGDLFFYWLARLLEKRLLRYAFFQKLFNHERQATIARNLEQHPILTIVGSRFISVATVIVNVLAGLTEYPFGKFLVWDIVGEVGSTVLYTTIGYIFGSHWTYVTTLLEKTGFIVILILALFGLWQWSRYRNRHAS